MKKRISGTVGSSQADREQAFRWAMSNFDPGGVLEIALRTEQKGVLLPR